MKAFRLLTAMASILAFGLSPAKAATSSVPLSFSHHGILWDGNNLADGEVNMAVTLYHDDTEIASYQGSVSVEEGFYSVTISDIPLDKLKEAAGHITLGIKVGNEPELKPRIVVNSVPFAIVAGHADTAAVATEAAVADKATVADKADSADSLNCTECVGMNNISKEVKTAIEESTSRFAPIGVASFITKKNDYVFSIDKIGNFLGINEITATEQSNFGSDKKSNGIVFMVFFDSDNIMTDTNYNPIINVSFDTPSIYVNCTATVLTKSTTYFSFYLSGWYLRTIGNVLERDEGTLCGNGMYGYAGGPRIDIMVYK